MFKELSITLDDDETKYTFAEWSEVPNILEITLSSWANHHNKYQYVHAATLPALSKEDWEEFKRAGDAAFDMMRNKVLL